MESVIDDVEFLMLPGELLCLEFLVLRAYSVHDQIL